MSAVRDCMQYILCVELRPSSSKMARGPYDSGVQPRVRLQAGISVKWIELDVVRMRREPAGGSVFKIRKISSQNVQT
jgi:hypothetical protein